MADDEQGDQIGSNIQKKNKRGIDKIRKSTRNKLTSSTEQSSTLEKSSLPLKLKSKRKKEKAKSAVKSSSEPKIVACPHSKLRKVKSQESQDQPLPGPSGVKKKKSETNCFKSSLKEDLPEANIDKEKTSSTRSRSKTSLHKEENKELTLRSKSDSKVNNSPQVKPRKTKSETDASNKKGRKRKAKEVPTYSPKRLRSSSRSNPLPVVSKETAAKTGGRLSRLRSASGAGETGDSSDNLGSCASSRRQRRSRRNRGEVPAMENERNSNSTNQEVAGNNGGSPSNNEASSSGATVSFPASGGSSSSQDGEAGLGLEESDISRLQAILEARGLPAHLFGSLGPRMHLLLHKTFNSGAGTKAQQLITSMQSDNEGTQLQGVMEMCQLLVMGNEETLGGFPVKQVVPVLIELLQMKENFDIMNHACRALTYLMEALPRSSVVVIDAVPALLEKLQTIECMDVAEQALTALEMLSKRHGKNILQAGGLGSSLLFLDFFSIVAQRSALGIAANCCHSVTADEFHCVKDSIAILSNRLNNQDKKSLESVCLAFARLVDNVQKEKELLESLCEHSLLSNLKQLLVLSPPVISCGSSVMVIRMLAVMCSRCPSIAVKLIKLDIAETIRYLLIGSNDIPLDDIVELVPRSPQELYEITCLICELLPNLPTTGIFSVDGYLNKGASHNNTLGSWQWRDDKNSWHTYLWVDNRIIEAAYQSGEDEISLSTLGRNYIIDFTSMQQINEDTGTIRSIQRKAGTGQQASITSSKVTEEKRDERSIIFDTEPSLGKTIVQSLIAVVYDVYYSSVGPAVKHKCLCSILKMLYHAPRTLLKDVLVKIPISSYIAGMLSSKDLRITCSALQKSDILMSKLSDTFHVYFRREGVMHKIKKLADSNPSPCLTPQKNNVILEEEEKHSQAIASTSSGKKSNSATDLPKGFEDLGDNGNDLSTPTSTSRLAAFKSKRKNLKRFGRQRSSKTSVNDDSPPSANTKRLSHEPMRPKSATFSSFSSSSGSSNKGSFFSNFAPRWGHSQSYQNNASSSSNTSEKSLKEKYLKEQEQNKEKVKLWIKKTAQEFYDRYFAEEAGYSHPALDILQKLTSSSDELSLNSTTDVKALQGLCEVLLNEDIQAGASPFEIVHSGMVTKLLKYITCEGCKTDIPRATRIKRFLSTFFGIQEHREVSTHTEIKTSIKPPIVPLVQKLNLCINQLEQFPVKCQDIPGASMAGGSRGSSALRFFNTHQIKCHLQRHPDCTNVKQWSGGAVKIDPLALVQAIERYLVVRGYGRTREDIDNEMSDDDDRSDDEIEESWATQLQGSGNSKHVLEFTLNGHVLPYNMTVYQAVRQYAQANFDEESEIDDDTGPFGRASIWSGTHTLYFKPICQQVENKNANVPKRTKSDFSVKSILRSKTTSMIEAPKQNGFAAYLDDKLPGDFSIKDPSLEVICLLRVLFHLNSNWGRYFDLQTSRAAVSTLEFVNTKLTAKATRQLQDPLVIMTGNLPSWLVELAKACAFIFPFECRQLLFYTTTFDRDRAVMKLQETVPDLATADSSDRVTPRLDKKKRTVSRKDLLKQAENVITDFINTKSLLEIQYEGEVGTGLGPTLEFYTLVSKEFQKADQEMFRGDYIDIFEGEGDSQTKLRYFFSRDGLFPAALPKGTKMAQLTKLKNKFRFLGRFLAKACMDSRMVDIPFSQTFYKCMLGLENELDLSDMQYVDRTLHKSLSQLYEVILQKKKLEDDAENTEESLQLALDSLTLDGVLIEDLGLDFVLPGTHIELKKGGKDIPVTIENLEEYLQCVIQLSLKDGVHRQIQAFKEGFGQFFSISSLQMFYPNEMELLLCGSKNEKWDVKELMECCRPDHGYTTDSRAVKYLFEIMSKYTSEEQRMFLQFITGSPKLPVGGFKSLTPPLTVVRKTVDGSLNADDYLPSVMTCVNYLKLPDYSTVEIMSDKLRTAYLEGKNAFHLS